MTSVRVAVRARPFSEKEVASDSWCCLEMRGQYTTLYNCKYYEQAERKTAKMFHFDYSYWSVKEDDQYYVDQEKMFKDIGWPVIESTFAGYNSCIFAYGQTGSGKTYTMTGSATNPGIIPRICKELFNQMKNSKIEKSYRTELSYFEIYNEKVRDLLVEVGGAKSLRVREHPKDGPYVQGLSQHRVVDYLEIASLLQSGNLQRATASTKMNDSSSRSHAIFTLTVTQAVLECGVPSETRSKLHLVDLAGSERASATGAEGVRLKEGGSINRSLVCLGTVISSLADKTVQQGKKAQCYIPYRDSVLTYLLKDSLGGNAKTVMIATVSPSITSYGETLSTLRYASRARAIVNKPVVNEDSNVKVIRELRSEIERLRDIITNQHLNVDAIKTTTGALVTDLHQKEEKVVELTKEWASKWNEIQHIMKTCEVDLQSDGTRLVLKSQQPHLVGMDPDIFSTGLVILSLKGDTTRVGSTCATPPPDISIAGPDIAEEHCNLVMNGRKVLVVPLNGDCYVNNNQVTSPSRLRQGDLLQLGSAAVFRFNHPHEARRLQKRHSDTRLNTNQVKKKNRPKSTSDTLTPVPPLHDPAICVVELKSDTFVETQGISSCTSFSNSRLEQSKRSILSLYQEEQMSKEWNPLLIVKMAMSPLTVLSSVLRYRTMPIKETQSGEVAKVDTKTSEVEAQPSCWWRRLLYTIFLICHTPLLLSVVGVLTWPVFSMLAFLLTSLKMCSLLQKYWISHWIVFPLALLAKLLAIPVATCCDIIFKAGFSALIYLHLLPSPTNRVNKQ